MTEKWTPEYRLKLIKYICIVAAEKRREGETHARLMQRIYFLATMPAEWLELNKRNFNDATFIEYLEEDA